MDWCTSCSFMWLSCWLQIIHTFFKSRLTFLTSDTVDGPSSTEKCIRLRHYVGNQGGGGRGFQKRGREHGGRGRGRSWDSKRQKTNEGDSDQPYDARGSDGWPSERPKFLQFVPLHLYFSSQPIAF
jgi:tRNA pseudouridine13 synthase